MSDAAGEGIWLELGDHTAHLFDRQSEKKAVLLSFFAVGLASGESCLLITGDSLADDWCFELQAYGIDVLSERSRGTLRVIEQSEWRSESFESISQARKTLGLIRRMTAESKGLCIAFDGEWTQNPVLPADLLCHWEAASNLVYQGQKTKALCQYDLTRHAPDTIRAVLRTHETIILDGKRRENSFYEAPLIYG
jgi:hypothetical protein